MSYPLPARHAGRGSDASGALPLDAATVTLDEHGVIVECDVDVEILFGYRGSELRGRHISFLLPELARIPLLRSGAVNPRLAFLCHCGKRFTAARREGWAFFVELFLNRVEGSAHGPLVVMIRAAEGALPAHARSTSERAMDR
jgi:PAS domain S-box-containing protein